MQAAIDLQSGLERLFPSAKKPLKIIRLIGYSRMNTENDPNKAYSVAKRPCMKGWQDLNRPGMTEGEIRSWLRQKGWTGLVIPDGYDVIDIDEQTEGELIFKALLREGYKFHAIRTIRGFQFFFRSTGKIKGQDATVLMAGGFVGDYRLSGRGQVVLPSENTGGREWVHIADGELSPMPIYFERLKKIDKAQRPFPIPMHEGGRNNALYAHCCRLVEFGYTQEQVHEIASFLNRYFFLPPLDQREFATTLNSALKHEPSGTNYSSPPPMTFPARKEGETKKFNLTEMGNAERLVARNGQNLRYCVEFEEWLIWDGKTWVEDKKKQIERIAIRTFREMYVEAAHEENNDARNELLRWAKASEKSSVFINSIARAEAMLPISQEELNMDKFLLNCANGVVDLRTGELLPHDRKYMMTKNTHIPYDPNAKCPTWIAFLESIFRDGEDVKQDIIHFLQKAIGYTLTGDISEQVVFFLWGTGRNGKSTFINTVKALLGDYAKQTNSNTFTAKMNDSGINNDIARLHGSRFVSAVESEDGQRLSESLIKQLTGGEPITARFLRKEFFEFVPEFKIFFTTNHKPIIKGDDEGIWRRIRLVPFTYTIPKEQVDKHLPEKLMNELPGILRWAVEGCLKWQKEGLGEPDEIKNATDEYKEEMDLLSNFLNDCCVIHPSAQVKLGDLYKEYVDWCEENSELAMKKQKFSARLVLRGFEKRKSTGNQTFFFGIGLSSESYKVTRSCTNQGKSPIMDNFSEIPKNSHLKVTSNFIEEEI